MSVGSVRRSSRLSAAVLPQASPCSNTLTPRRVTRRSLALTQTPLQAALSPAQQVLTPAHLRLTLNQTPAQAPQSQRGTPQSSKKRKDIVNVSVCFSPVREVLSNAIHSDGSTAQQSHTVSTQDDTASAPELGITIPDLFPPTAVAEKQVEPAEAVHLDIPVCPRLSLSPCKMPPPFSQAPEPSSLSFTLSPCVTPSQPSIPPHTAVQSPMEAQESLLRTPDSSVVEVNTFLFVFVLKKSQPHNCPFT